MKDACQHTRILMVGYPDLVTNVRAQLAHHPCLRLINAITSSKEDPVRALEAARPDILLLDLVAAAFTQGDLYAAAQGMERPPHIVAIGPGSGPYLAAAQQQPLTRATLLTQMTASPLLAAVLTGVANGYTYYVPPPTGAQAYRLEEEELCVLRLMAVGFDTEKLARALGHKRDAIYYTQRKIRRKLKALSNQQAVVVAIRDGIVGVLARAGQAEGA